MPKRTTTATTTTLTVIANDIYRNFLPLSWERQALHECSEWSAG